MFAFQLDLEASKIMEVFTGRIKVFQVAAGVTQAFQVAEHVLESSIRDPKCD